MAEQHKVEAQCIKAFKNGNKREAEQLLPHTRRAAVLTTTFRLTSLAARLVSLLHLAAYHGWLDVVAEVLGRA